VLADFIRPLRLGWYLKQYRQKKNPAALASLLQIMAGVADTGYTPQHGLTLVVYLRTERIESLIQQLQKVISAMHTSEYCTPAPFSEVRAKTLDDYLTTAKDCPIRLEWAIQQLANDYTEWVKTFKTLPLEKARYYKRHTQHLETDLYQLINVLIGGC
jgi:hypothetical protein